MNDNNAINLDLGRSFDNVNKAFVKARVKFKLVFRLCDGLVLM